MPSDHDLHVLSSNQAIDMDLYDLAGGTSSRQAEGLR
jgi:hypothetical protein